MPISIDTHAFVVAVDTSIEDTTIGDETSLITTSSSQTITLPKFSRKIRWAESVPFDEALDEYLPWYEDEARELFKTMQPTTCGPDAKFLRILILDDSLPEPTSTHDRPAVVKPEHTAGAPANATDEAIWRPFLDFAVEAVEH